MGAEVIKVETPGVIRDGLSWYFAGFNRNKRSLTLNLRLEEGCEVLAKLIAGSDVLVENFRPGVLARIGFDKERLELLNPDLVCCHITGFADGGPYRDRPSFDFIAQAMSGFMSVTGAPDGPPLRAGPPIGDLVAGLYAALGVCAALARHGRTGHGETLGASLNSAMIGMLGFLAANCLATGEQPARTGNDHCDRLALWHVPHPPMARWRSHRRARRFIIGCSTRSARPSCGTTPISAAMMTAFRTAGR
jgi:CoA:oxalate CoA-transferase